MPLQIDHVYTDRARLHQKKKGSRVEHETRTDTYISEWFISRIAPPEGQQRKEAQLLQIDMSHVIICKLTDTLGSYIPDPQEQDEIEVQIGATTPGLGAGTYKPYGIFQIVRVIKPRSLVEELLWVLWVHRLKEA